MTFYYKTSMDMSELEDSSIALIITSPPYPMIEKWDRQFSVLNFHYQHDQLMFTWEECRRVLIPGGIMCINIGDATRTIKPNGFQCYPNFAKVTISMFNMGFSTLVPIHWRKISNRPNAFLGSGMQPPNAYVSQDHEYIGIFRKGNLRKFPPKDANRLSSSFTKDERDRWFSQVWNIQGAKGAKASSAFPDEIPYRLIRMFSVIGDSVLDPFCGSGSVMRIAEENGRVGIGYDIVDYINPIKRPRRPK